MPYEFSPRAREVLADVVAFMNDHVYPNEEQFAAEAAVCGTGDPPLLDKLKAAARERGLWNLFLPHLSPDAPGTKLTNLDYAPVSEQLGKVVFASDAPLAGIPMHIKALDGLNLDAATRQKIMHGNAEKLLNMRIS